MNAENMIGMVVISITALILIVIGTSQIRQKNPTGFYTGEKPPKESELKDVRAWNRRHGLMWIGYGCVIELCTLGGFIFGNALVYMLLFWGAVIVPLPLMMWCHHRLLKQYRKMD